MPDDELFDLPIDDASNPDLEHAQKLFEIFGQHKYDKVVAFVDMLGFSALTEDHRVEPDVLEELQRPGAIDFLTASLEGSNALSERFIRFHLIIEDAVRNARLPEDGSSITFSDCAFYAADKLHSVIDYAVHVMHRSLEERIPVRIGIACGEFLVVRIRADFGMANQDHVVQFLGSGVSRAHAAEHCGIKGLRILLHPSVMPLYTEHWYQEHLGPAPRKYHDRIPLPAADCSNRAKVDHEINYIWHPRHDDNYWTAVQDLRDVAPAASQGHYAATIVAVNRMRQALGTIEGNISGRPE
jgi:hypothetical protein